MSALPFVCRAGSEALEPVSVLARETPRPSLVCPVCREPVVLVRGKYARHREGTECARHDPESALHKGMKETLARELVHLDTLWVSHVGGLAGLPRSWVRADVEVVPHGLTDRLDLALFGPTGVIVLAVEVCDTSPVVPNKAAALDRRGIPWLEVAAEPGEGWGTPARPLRAIRVGSAPRLAL